MPHHKTNFQQWFVLVLKDINDICLLREALDQKRLQYQFCHNKSRHCLNNRVWTLSRVTPFTHVAHKIKREKTNEWNNSLVQLHIVTQSSCPCVYVSPLWLGVPALIKHIWSCDSAGWQRCIWIFLCFQKCAFYISPTTSLANDHMHSRDQHNDTGARSPSRFLFPSLSSPPAHLPSVLDGWEAEMFKPLVCS